MSANFQQLANFIWSVADPLRGPYRPPQYERVMLPLTVLRRFDAVLASSKEAELWRGKLQAFRNLYSFLNQVIPYQDSDLEKLFTYLRHLALKLPKRKSGSGYQFDE